MARVSYVDPDAADGTLSELYAELRGRGRDVLQLYRALGHSPAALRAVMALGSNLVFVDDGPLSGALTELLILRVAWRSNADYVWGRHVQAALARGASPALIAAITDEVPGEPFNTVARLALQVTDEVVLTVEASEEAVDALVAAAGERAAVHVITLAAGYAMVARITRSLGLELEDGDPRPTTTRQELRRRSTR